MKRGATPPGLQALAWYLADAALVTVMLAIVKAVGRDLPSVQIVFVRSLVGLVLVVPVVMRLGLASLRIASPALHLLRVGAAAAALTLNFHAVARLPLATVTTISFTRPIMTVVLAALVLRETVGGRRWIATLVGLLGVLVIAQPGTVTIEPAFFIAFAGAFAGTVSVVATRRLASQDSPAALMVTYTAAITLLTAIPAALAWRPLETADWPVLLSIGVLAQLGQYCFIRAYRLADAAFLAPFGYLQLILSTATGLLVFGERPSMSLVLGAAIIIASAIALARSEQKKVRRD
jgi:S-adenosylmethionine uptake transporter